MLVSAAQSLYTRIYFGANRPSLKNNFYALTDRLISGQEISMEKFKGDVLVIVNVASKWGLTEREYTQLAHLVNEFGSQGLQVLAFPCNQFAGQEPGGPDEIMATGSKYGATPDKVVFFEKGDVNGARAREVFSFLKERLPFDDGTTHVLWNFGKFLIDHQGNPRERFGSSTPALDMKRSIMDLLDERNGTGSA
jgi:glutathione peroxidase-family protein